MWLIDKGYSICVELSTGYAVDLVFHSIIESEFYKSGYSVCQWVINPIKNRMNEVHVELYQ